MRIGHGFDIHAFGGNRPLVIGGVNIPFKQGVVAHSDGDVALHALMDALLGALAMGDIGEIFPNTEQKFKNANSRDLLRKIWHLIQLNSYIIGNLDLTIIAEAPKMLLYIPQMRINISKDLGCDVHRISIKSTTNEKLGFIGRGEGIACEALSLLKYHNKQ
ncbi:2-C-methyl-D-erythritol 2,4-cyclodiphosphate synthase [Candidatus Pantoea carbekii]|uniref:2-C-methyl-D-erythritol 2,4-cyclodiphosphate synthase n=1 Tax=Candidatus Pantoea carbekii TaxID=1235990 RepID=UPI0005C4E208|nr:2-C-methyl-D-erythritol 2,4-cyclodiphosphate synthase [Candidatus Pantoea carbekii]